MAQRLLTEERYCWLFRQMNAIDRHPRSRRRMTMS
jgi:hypothetical protein